MITIVPLETSKSSDHSISETFLIGSLDIGQGVTLGSTIRRILLNDMTGYAITGVKIHGVSSEYSILKSSREDVLEILGNLQQIIFQESSQIRSYILNSKKIQFKAFINVKGPCIVTASMLNLPKNTFIVINPEQYICTLNGTSDFFCEVNIELGRGYRSSNDQLFRNESGNKSQDENQWKKELINYRSYKEKDKKKTSQPSGDFPTLLAVDAIFTPVKKVFFKVNFDPDEKGVYTESLILTIVSKGNSSPRRCLQEALKCLIEMIFPLIHNSQILQSFPKKPQKTSRFQKIENLLEEFEFSEILFFFKNIQDFDISFFEKNKKLKEKFEEFLSDSSYKYFKESLEKLYKDSLKSFENSELKFVNEKIKVDSIKKENTKNEFKK